MKSTIKITTVSVTFFLFAFCIVSCNNGPYPKDENGNPTNLIKDKTPALEFNIETIVSQLNKNLPDPMLYDFHFDRVTQQGANQINFYYSRPKTDAAEMTAKNFAKTQEEMDMDMYKNSTAWYYEECRKRNIKIEFHYSDKDGKEFCKHLCSN